MEGDLAPDQAPGAPHPRCTTDLSGHEMAEHAFLEAWRTGRLHHAWLIHGPRGVGKATLAYRIARFLFAQTGPDAQSLEVPRDHPAAKRIRAGHEERLQVLRRIQDPKARPAAKRRYFTVIRVDEVRALRTFFQRTPVSGGWRVAVVDAADDMSDSANNAFLKVLEEPPQRSLILLASHAPRSLPATIRSRCRRLRLNALAGADFEQAIRSAAPALQGSTIRLLEQESDGSPGEALRIHALGGVDLRREITNLLADLPAIDRRRLATFTASLGGADRREQRMLAAGMLERALVDLARAAAGAEGPASDLARRLGHLAGNADQARIWADTASGLRSAIETAGSVNIDPSATFLSALATVETAAAQASLLAA